MFCSLFSGCRHHRLPRIRTSTGSSGRKRRHVSIPGGDSRSAEGQVEPMPAAEEVSRHGIPASAKLYGAEVQVVPCRQHGQCGAV